MHNLWKIWFANNIFSLWKRLVFAIKGPSKLLFFTFCLFPLPKFLKTFVKNLITDFEGFSNFYYAPNIFDLHIFENETAALLFIFFSICTDMHFGSLFFLNERNMTTSLLMIRLKFTVVHYTNSNWAYKNKPFLNYGSLNMVFRFFISSLCLF